MGPVLKWLAVSLVVMSASVESGVASMTTRGKFGFVGDKFLRFKETNGFPNTKDFFYDHVFRSKPLIMRGAAKSSPAFNLWQTDEYFLEHEIPEDELVTVETTKKENRTREVLDLNFREFLESYKAHDRYMVHRVPEFLGRDVIIPRPLQCPHIYQNSIVEAIMWFSSGGTNSVVHTDSVDNLNCVYAGEKNFVMIDHQKYADMVLFDHPEGAYSDIDVDNVDYTKYKSLLSVEYYHVNLQRGDCFFIPYKWIHQVRSSGPRNIAINIWWDTHRNQLIDFTACSPTNDASLTLDKIEFIPFHEVMQTVTAIRDQFHDQTRHMPLTLKDYISFNVGTGEIARLGAGLGYTLPLQKIFTLLDRDGDGFATHDEVRSLSNEIWNEVLRELDRFQTIMDALNRRWEEEHNGLNDGALLGTRLRDEL